MSAPTDRPLRAIIDSGTFRSVVLGLIVVNALAIGLQTYPAVEARFGAWLELADRTILYLFTAEIFLRLGAARTPREFLTDPWQWFDIIVVTAGYASEAAFMTVFRLLRVLRVLRTFTVMPQLQIVVNSLLESIAALANILIVLGLLFYVYGTAGTFLFGDIRPELFGTLDRSLLTLFQIVTLEGWGAVMRSILPRSPFCWLYFISFIVLGPYCALNSLIAVVAGKLRKLGEEDELADVRAALKRLEARLK